MKNINKKVIIIILSIILTICIVYIGIKIYNSIENKKMYESLEENRKNIEQVDNEQSSEYVSRVKNLQKENEDVKGWIKIDDTIIDYPLLQTTDNEYYLDHNYKKEKTNYGSIFINCNSNLKDENANVIMYGHDMKDGQMFKGLLNYSKESYYKEHPEIILATDEKEYKYQIVCAFKSRVFYKNEKDVFRFYRYFKFENENEYNEYISNCKKIELYNTGVEAKFGEQLITLITCEYSQKNGRMVVVAKRVN